MLPQRPAEVSHFFTATDSEVRWIKELERLRDEINRKLGKREDSGREWSKTVASTETGEKRPLGEANRWVGYHPFPPPCGW